MKVTKRDGRDEDLNIEKIHKVLQFATDGLDASISDIEMNAQLQFHDGIETNDIHNSLVKSASDLISRENPDYQYVAARLLLYKLRKDVWGESEPPRLLEHIKKCVNLGVYDKAILDYYTESEIHKIGKIVDQDRDDRFTYAGIQQLVDKYLCQDRLTGEIYETPQFAYIMIAMTLFASYPKNQRISYIKKAYNAFSLFKINLPTPIMAGVRTVKKQFASCTLFDVDDTLKSITANLTGVMYYTADRAGIGLNVGRIRAIKSKIRNGEVLSTGIIPFLRIFQNAVKSCQQNGIRGGSATCFNNWWHYEILDYMVLKNNGGTDDNRVKNLDYTVCFDRLFFERLMNGESVSLFSPSEAPELYDAFGTPEFKSLYEKYESDTSIRRKTIKAQDLIDTFLKERLETGRIYAMFLDNEYNQGVWKEKVNNSNLCLEICHPLSSIQHIDDKDGEIGVCILSAVNVLETQDDELEEVCDIIVRMLDELIDYQDYPIKAAENFCVKRRSLGIGLTNFAALLAKNGLSYSDDKETLTFVDELMEKVQYYLLKSSCNLAKKKGRCEKYELTKYSDGLLPQDRCHPSVKHIRDESMDWSSLRKNIEKYGLRHSTLTAQMPVDSSSVIQNSTHGIEPPRDLLIQKRSKYGTLKQIVPGLNEFSDNYTLAFDCDNKHINSICSILQKWMDMSLSLNHYYDYEKFPNEKIPLSAMLGDIVDAYKKGVKTLYYANSKDKDTEKDESGCESGSCAI